MVNAMRDRLALFKLEGTGAATAAQDPIFVRANLLDTEPTCARELLERLEFAITARSVEAN